MRKKRLPQLRRLVRLVGPATARKWLRVLERKHAPHSDPPAPQPRCCQLRRGKRSAPPS